jgi:hypothetical protein
LAKLKTGDYSGAVADYDQSLLLRPNWNTSLYGRALAKLKQGDKGGGKNDLQAAKLIDPGIVKEFQRYDTE